MQNKDFIYIEILGAPFVRRILMDLLNDPYYKWLPDNVPNYILQNFNARSSGNALELHIDSRIPIVRPQPISCQVIYLLEDMNEENGCSVVVPGTHRSGSYTDRDLKNVLPLHAKAGDLVVWDSRLWHGTLENNSDRSRWALILCSARASLPRHSSLGFPMRCWQPACSISISFLTGTQTRPLASCTGLRASTCRRPAGAMF